MLAVSVACNLNPPKYKFKIKNDLAYYLNLLLQMWTNVQILAPLDHALEDADQTFETFGSNSSKLIRRGTDLKGLTTPSNLWYDVNLKGKSSKEPFINRQAPIFLSVSKNFFLDILCKYDNFSSFLDRMSPVLVTVFSNLTKLTNDLFIFPIKI